MILICRVRTREALHTFELHFCHVTEKSIFTDNFLLTVLVYFLQNQEGNTSTSHETWKRLQKRVQVEKNIYLNKQVQIQIQTQNVLPELLT